MALCRYHGGFAERVAVQAATCVRIPDDLDFVRAAALPIAYSMAIIALQRRGELASGERLLVLGAAGGVGLATVELGRQLGAEVIAAAGSAAKLSLAADRGASHGVNYRDENLRERVMELTDGAGVDVVFDSVGGAASEQVMRCLARGGRQLLVGFASGKIPELRANRLLLANTSAVGVYVGDYAERQPETVRAAMEQSLRMWRLGEIRVHISHVLPLGRAVEALQLLQRRESAGRVVLKIA